MNEEFNEIVGRLSSVESLFQQMNTTAPNSLMKLFRAFPTEQTKPFEHCLSVSMIISSTPKVIDNLFQL